MCLVPCGIPRLLFGLCAILFSAAASAEPLVIDDFSYTNTAAARKVWVNTSGPSVTMSDSGDWGSNRVMVLTCDFATRSSRCTWDRAVTLDLSLFPAFELEVFAPDPGTISAFTLYFRSGAGWYGASATLNQPGWQTLRFSVEDFIPEGTPAGWAHIDGIRLSPWKAAPANTYLALRRLAPFIPAVALVRDTQSSNPDVVQQTIDRHLTWLGGFGISCGVISRKGVEAGLLQGSRLAILPYNESVSEFEMSKLETFVAGGGKLIVYYLLPGRLASLLGVKVTGWTRGDFAAWKFSEPAIPDLPSRVEQASWNITLAEPAGTFGSKTIATWENSLGQNTGKVAWLRSDNGFFMSHILLADDANKKSFALLCLIGSQLPDISGAAATAAIAQIGQVGPFRDYVAAVNSIGQQPPLLRSMLVRDALTATETNRARALEQEAGGQLSQAILSAQAARTSLKRAYLLSLKPVAPEFRAIWEHHATGPYPGNWNAGVESLATNQFTAVFPNMLWGGLAHYNSAYLPLSDDYRKYGDQIAACVSAAHARGLQVHVWKVNWNLLGAPQSFIDEMRAANRTQVSKSGAPVDWLCPSHPDNFALETNSMLEVVRNYDIDGIHFDYIRYPNSDSCYCSGCRTRFAAQTGYTITNWPAQVLATGLVRTAFLDWRRAQITRLVSAVFQHTKALKPSVKVSAAVFPDPVTAFDDVGQDWRLWITNGIVDFLCPMDYTTGLANFTNLVARQMSYANGRIPLYPGIGAYVLETDATAAQIQATREAHTGGFTVFELSPGSAATLLPSLGAGATAPDEPDTDNDFLPDAWELHWFTNLTTAGLNTDTDEDGLTDEAEYIAGTDPNQPANDLSLDAKWTNGQLLVSFKANAAEGPGYRDTARHYRLETSVSPAELTSWSAVRDFPEYVPQAGRETFTGQFSPEPDTARFYRIQVWLQQKTELVPVK